MTRYAAGFLFVDGKILLGLRSAERTLAPGVWDFIGGHCRPDESYEGAMVRELAEETGIEVLAAQELWTLETATMGFYIFWITHWEGIPQNLQPDEHERLGWFRLEELAGLAFPEPDYQGIFEELFRKLYD